MTPAEAQAAAMLWPELEEPLERDALIDQLAAARWPDDEAFFLAVLAHDQDLAVQHAAALALAQRAHAAGPAWLMAGLQEDDEGRFNAAAEAIVGLEGEAAYLRLSQVWRDAARDRGIRRQALRQMEAASLPRALADIAAQLDVATADSMDEAELEAALWAVAHHRYVEARPVLEHLRAHLAAPPVLAVDAQTAGDGGRAARLALVDTALRWLDG